MKSVLPALESTNALHSSRSYDAGTIRFDCVQHWRKEAMFEGVFRR